MFIKLLNKIYLCFQENESINTKIYYRVGEHIKFEDKKYSLFSIEVSAENINHEKSKELEILTTNSNFYIDVKKKITINIPMITE